MTEHTYVRHDTTFLSEGTRCAAWLYRPDGVGNPPIVVMAHGFAAFRELRLDAYADRFARAGYAVLVFDYRFWGASDGEPRRILDIKAQHADWQAAVAYARGLDGVDATRLVAWGSSFAGGHVLHLLARDHAVAAGIVQVPHVNGPASAFSQPATQLVRLFIAGVRDQLGAWLGAKPYRTAAIGRPGDLAMMTSPGAIELVEQMAGEHRDKLLTENDVAARIALRVPFYSPGRYASRITVPTLVQLASNDDVTPMDKALKAARRIPRGEVLVYECSHFEPYLEPHFDRIVADQIDFLRRHIGQG
ncbi:MAG: alpha/beta hydrolase [Mycolicibacterium hassiacum]|jgi:dienelactone hydrolase|nr:MAG: alpha/beta hydrolase [Mycolicibacterium hassiacum]